MAAHEVLRTAVTSLCDQQHITSSVLSCRPHAKGVPLVMRRWALFTFTLTPHGLHTTASDTPAFALDAPTNALDTPSTALATPELIGAAASHENGSKVVVDAAKGNGVGVEKSGVRTIDIQAAAVSASTGKTSMLAYSGTAYCLHASFVHSGCKL